MSKIQSRDDLVWMLTHDALMPASDAAEVADMLVSSGITRMAKFAILAGRIRTKPAHAAEIIAALEEFIPAEPSRAYDAKAASEVNALAKRVAEAHHPTVAAILRANAELFEAEMAMIGFVHGEDVSKIASDDAKAGPLAAHYRTITAAKRKIQVATKAWMEAGRPGI